jgi:alpha-glucosidase
MAGVLSAQVKLASPDGRIEITFATRAANADAADGALFYRIDFQGKPVLDWSRLGLQLQGQPPLGDRMKVESSKAGSGDETYRMPHGKANPIRNVFRSVSMSLVETQRPFRRLGIEARAYDDGAAFRYLIPDQPAIKELRVSAESTQFRFAEDSTAFPLILSGYRTSYEDDYHKLPLSGLHEDYLIALPLLVDVPGAAFVGLTEAHIENWAGMYVQRTRDARTLEARLAPRVDQPGLAVGTVTPAQSPWRAFMIGDHPGRLIESNLVVNLNPPSAIADASWVKPGKTSWDWWSGSVARNAAFKSGMNTDTMKHYIDFSSKAGLEYMLIDAGWALRATGPNDSGGDLTQATPAINMPELLEYAKARNVRLWVWAHWTDVERQMDEVFPLFQKWGIAGVKIDFMDRDDQWMVEWYRRVAKKAAEHRLMLDFHGAFKPDGLRRTYPNVMTREGVMGLEYTKWSARVTPAHNVMLAYTRMLAGPMDYTPGGFENVTREAFVPRFRMPMVMGTRAHQTALFVVFESPFQMLADDPGAYEGEKELEFLKAVPATWEETRVVNGVAGEYITVARRLGREWYLGSITDWNPRELEVPLRFLGAGEYIAETYSDAPDAAQNPKNSVREEKKVNASMTLNLKLAPGGGQAIRFRPAK